MSFDLFAWKWAPGTEGTVDPYEVYLSLNESDDHEALVKLDAAPLINALKGKFGDVNSMDESPFSFGLNSKYMTFEVAWSAVERIVPELKKIIQDAQLCCYDPQDHESPRAESIANKHLERVRQTEFERT